MRSRSKAWLGSKRLLATLIAAALFSLGAPAVRAVDRAEPLPHELDGVGITEKPNAQLPFDAQLFDEQGQVVTLGSFFKPKRPVILTLNYYSCPMLCTLVLNGAVEAMREIPFVPGQQFEVVTISIDPRDDARVASMKKANYVASLGKDSAANGWHFLTGTEAEVRRVANAVGFSYNWVEERKEYAHAAAIFVITPEGHVSRYLYGVKFEPRTLRLSLAEAADGEIGTAMDQFLLFCFHYDSDAGRYTVAAVNFVRLGGLLTMLTLGILLARFWRVETRRRQAAAVTGH